MVSGFGIGTLETLKGVSKGSKSKANRFYRFQLIWNVWKFQSFPNVPNGSRGEEVVCLTVLGTCGTTLNFGRGLWVRNVVGSPTLNMGQGTGFPGANQDLAELFTIPFTRKSTMNRILKPSECHEYLEYLETRAQMLTRELALDVVEKRISESMAMEIMREYGKAKRAATI